MIKPVWLDSNVPDLGEKDKKKKEKKKENCFPSELRRKKSHPNKMCLGIFYC